MSSLAEAASSGPEFNTKIYKDNEKDFGFNDTVIHKSIDFGFVNYFKLNVLTSETHYLHQIALTSVRSALECIGNY